ncbi:MAG TPA: hypothetical protein VGM51_16120 [Armatimonadota bacterium]|jgi:lipid-A-disaccharide synthase
MADVFIVTGEASGDAVGAGLASELRRLKPDVVISGVGAARMQAAEVSLWANSRQWAAMGIMQSVPIAGSLLLLLKRLKRHLLAARPDLLVLVDFGAFNVRLGRWAVEAGIRTVYLMPPGSWRKQTREDRLRRLAASADFFFCPFEWNARNLQSVGANAEHIGHPVLDLAAPTENLPALKERLRPRNGRLIALLPGSRRQEVGSLAPLMAEIIAAWPCPEDRFVMVRALSFREDEFAACLPEGLDSKMTIVPGGTADPLHASDMAVVCAGTATLEAAVAGKPMVVVNRGPWLMHVEWQLRKRSIRARYVAMPNIIAEREVVREFVDTDATTDNVFAALKSLADDPAAYAETERALAEVRNALRPAGALRTAATRIAALL